MVILHFNKFKFKMLRTQYFNYKNSKYIIIPFIASVQYTYAKVELTFLLIINH